MFKEQKTRLQILVDSGDLRFINNFADLTNAKNVSQAIHELIYDYSLMKQSIEKLKQRARILKEQETYEQIRTEQLKNLGGPNEVPQV